MEGGRNLTPIQYCRISNVINAGEGDLKWKCFRPDVLREGKTPGVVSFSRCRSPGRPRSALIWGQGGKRKKVVPESRAFTQEERASAMRTGREESVEGSKRKRKGLKGWCV